MNSPKINVPNLNKAVGNVLKQISPVAMNKNKLVSPINKNKRMVSPRVSPRVVSLKVVSPTNKNRNINIVLRSPRAVDKVVADIGNKALRSKAIDRLRTQLKAGQVDKAIAKDLFKKAIVDLGIRHSGLLISFHRVFDDKRFLHAQLSIFLKSRGHLTGLRAGILQILKIKKIKKAKNANSSKVLTDQELLARLLR